MATLKELSERTGYSTATISRVLNGDASFSVPEEVRRRILEEADKANYRETRSRRGRTPKNLLRIGIAEMLTPAQQLNDPYYLYLGNYVRQGCIDKKYVCIPLESRGESFELPRGEKLDGIIAIGYFSIAQVDSLGKLSSNVVFIDSSPFESKYDSVVVGYELGVSLALEFLVKLGHKHIGFVGPVWKFNDRRQDALEVRRQLFIRRMEARRKYDPTLMIDCDMDIAATIEAWKKYLAEGKPMPTAVLCANEENAVGTLNYLQQRGISIPEDISVVSFNDTPRSGLVSPALTSVSINTKEMAGTALRMLTERAAVSGKEPLRTVPLKVIVPPSIVVRDSTQRLSIGD